MGAQPLVNTFEFKYLGHHFQADGEGFQAIEERKKLAKVIFGKLHEFWSSSKLKQAVKLRMYICCVLSILSYGNAAWKLDDDTCRSLRGWNARCLARITGRDYRAETVDPTLDLVMYIRAQRLNWLGHTLRRTGHHPAKKIIMKMETDYSLKGGSILMDAPVKHDMEKLVEFAHDREEWRARVNELKSQVYKQ